MLALLLQSENQFHLKYLSMLLSYTKVEVVAPISAPILQIVPFPVAEREIAPSPKYSTIAPVPPFTVRIPATFKIISFGEVQPFNFPVNFTPISFADFIICNMIERKK